MLLGFIDCMGLLTSRGMEDFYPIFMDWENQNKPQYRPRWPARPFPDRPNAADPAYAEELASVCFRLPSLNSYRIDAPSAI